MYKSENINNLAVSLLKAQMKMGAASKDSKNPFFKSKFADYGSVLEVVKVPLNEEGVLLLQPHFYVDGKTFVETTLIHETGEWISSQTEVICGKQNDPQAFGAAITYARRYGLQSLLSIPAEDNDGEGAMDRTAPKVAAAKGLESVATLAPLVAARTEPTKEATSFRKPPRSVVPAEVDTLLVPKTSGVNF